jgi:hypothetical protein
MENKFIASSFMPAAYPVTFGLLALGLAINGIVAMALILLLLAIASAVIFAYSFRIYVISQDEFFTANLFGTKTDVYLFDDMLKIYTLKGYETIGRFGSTKDYPAVILKIQMINGEIFVVNIDEVFSVAEFVDALREKLGEHKFEVLN